MKFEEFKKLTPEERTALEQTERSPEDKAVFEELKKQFELEMEQEVENFKNEDKKVDQIVESVGLENADIVNEVKVEIGLNEKLNEMNNSAISVQWRFKEEFEDVKRSLKNTVDNATYKINSFIDRKRIEGVKKNIEIENNGSFNAKQELEKIKKLPKEEKEQALKSFKEKLSLTYQGIARVQANVIERVRANPELSEEEFINTMMAAAAEYGLGQDVIQKGHEYFMNYQEKHKAVTDFLNENPTSEEAFRALFLAKPKGIVELSSDPVSIYFVCHSAEDYAWIYNHKVIWQNHEGGEQQVEVSDDEMKNANMSGGAKLNHSILPQLTGMLGAMNGRYGASSESRKTEVKTHEMQHVWYDVVFGQNEDVQFRDSRQDKRDVFFRYLYSAIDAENVEKVRGTAVEYIKVQLDYALASAKNEVLAYLSDGSKKDRIFYTLEASINSAEQRPLYDFLEPLRTLRDKTIQKKISEYSKKNEEHISNVDIDGTENFVKENFEYIQKYVDYSIQKYNGVLINALHAIGRFVGASSKSNIYSRNEITALLTEVPLDQFPKVVERTLLKKTF